MSPGKMLSLILLPIHQQPNSVVQNLEGQLKFLCFEAGIICTCVKC